MPNKNQFGFAPIIIIAGIAVLIFTGAVIIKDTVLNTPVFNISTNQATSSAKLKISPTPTVISIKKGSTPTPTTKKASTTTITPTPTQTSNNQNNPTNTPTPDNPTNTPTPENNPTNTPTPTPTPTQNTGCDKAQTICFDRGEASVDITYGQNLDSMGWTAFAFNLQGQGAKGYNLLRTGLPDGFVVTPSSGAFTNNSDLPVKVWIKSTLTNYGTYTGTISLEVNNGSGTFSSNGQTLKLIINYKP